MKRKKTLKRILLTVVFVAIAAATIWAVMSWGRGMSLRAFFRYCIQADLRWLSGAALAMLGFIYFEGCAIRVGCSALGYKVRPMRGFTYASADLYFSAITPSATGGQPMCVWFMIHDGIPGSIAATILFLTQAMYSATIVILGLLALLFQPHVFIRFGLTSKILVIAGYVVQTGVLVLFALLIRSRSLLRRICLWGLHLLCRLHILKNEEKRREKVLTFIAGYNRYTETLCRNAGLYLRSFVMNVLQRVSQLSVTALVYNAVGGIGGHTLEMYAIQMFAVVGSNSVPIPGAMGVADYILIDGFSAFMPPSMAVKMELLSRSVSFYSLVFLCGMVALFGYLRRRRLDRNKE